MDRIPQLDTSRGSQSFLGIELARLEAQRLGYPADIPLETHTAGMDGCGHWVLRPREATDDSADEDMGAWRFHILGIPIRSHPINPEEPPDVFAYGYRNHEGEQRHWVRSIITQLFHPTITEVFLQRTYHRDGKIRLDLCGLNTCHRDDVTFNRVIAFVRTALDIMETSFPDGARGRPIGTGMPVTAEAVARLYWEWAYSHGTPPRQDNPDFAAKFFLRPRQLKERLRQLRERDGFTWPPTRPS